MNFDDKEKEQLDFEQLNIKSHLNTSMELKGISVSEDLINRTLKAINNQSVDKQDQPPLNSQQAELRKSFSINKFVRGFAGVAAAAIIIVAGTQLLEGNIGGSKKDLAIDMNSTAMEQKSSSENAGYGDESYSTLQDDTAKYESAQTEDAEVSFDDNMVTSDAGKQVDESNATALAPEATTEDMDFTGITSSTETEKTKLGFTQLLVPELTGTATVVVTKAEDKTKVTLTDQKDIEEFYLTMEKHQFTASTSAPANVVFQMELTTTEQNQTYLISVGEHLQVEYSDKQTTSMSTYDVVDNDVFQQDLMNLIDKYSK
ncbi:MAG: hypothetical protein K0R00_515 [Herbinix sp.]|jgi:hypothetical protein|nr:hypothetical protein [Herbinix sp.]